MSSWRSSPSTPTPPCTRSRVSRWADARSTTRKTKAKRVINGGPAKAGVFSGSQPHQNKSQSSVARIAGGRKPNPGSLSTKPSLG
jgi:hypothetical protein